MGVYYGLAEDGLLHDLGDCEDFDAAEDAALKLGLNVLWFADEIAANQWRNTLTKRNLGDTALHEELKRLLTQITLPEEMKEEYDTLTNALSLLGVRI